MLETFSCALNNACKVHNCKKHNRSRIPELCRTTFFVLHRKWPRIDPLHNSIIFCLDNCILFSIKEEAVFMSVQVFKHADGAFEEVTTAFHAFETGKFITIEINTIILLY